MKPNKELIVNEILGEMDFGITYKECMQLNQSKWKLTEGTFVRYWKEASARYLAANEREQKAKEVVRVQMAQESLKKAILSKHERMEILTQIARGEIPLVKHIVADGMIQEREVVPSWKDRRDAVAELNKMEGDYAPIKKDITSGGEPLKQITGIIVE
jgi:hypothetical protein